MDNKKHKKTDKTVQSVQHINTQTRPNEAASFSVEAHVKVFDPETNKIFVEKRA